MLCAPKRPPTLHRAPKSAGGGNAASGIGAFSLLMSQTQSRFGQSLQLAAVASSVWISRFARGQRQQRVGETVVERLPRHVRDQLRVRLVGDVEDHQATIDPADIDAVGPVR